MRDIPHLVTKSPMTSPSDFLEKMQKEEIGHCTKALVQLRLQAITSEHLNFPTLTGSRHENRSDSKKV